MSKQTALALTCLGSACGERGPASAREATVDTLPSGTLEVHNVASGAWTSESPGWSLVEDLRIGSMEGDSTVVFGYVGDIEVDNGGRIWVLELQPAGIEVFDREGAFVTSIGRRGEGRGRSRSPEDFRRYTAARSGSSISAAIATRS